MELLIDPIIIEDELPLKKEIVVGGGYGYVSIISLIIFIILIILIFNKSKVKDVSDIDAKRFSCEE